MCSEGLTASQSAPNGSHMDRIIIVYIYGECMGRKNQSARAKKHRMKFSSFSDGAQVGGARNTQVVETLRWPEGAAEDVGAAVAGGGAGTSRVRAAECCGFQGLSIGLPVRPGAGEVRCGSEVSSMRGK